MHNKMDIEINTIELLSLIGDYIFFLWAGGNFHMKVILLDLQHAIHRLPKAIKCVKFPNKIQDEMKREREKYACKCVAVCVLILMPRVSCIMMRFCVIYDHYVCFWSLAIQYYWSPRTMMTTNREQRRCRNNSGWMKTMSADKENDIMTTCTHIYLSSH